MVLMLLVLVLAAVEIVVKLVAAPVLTAAMEEFALEMNRELTLMRP